MNETNLRFINVDAGQWHQVNAAQTPPPPPAGFKLQALENASQEETNLTNDELACQPELLALTACDHHGDVDGLRDGDVIVITEYGLREGLDILFRDFRDCYEIGAERFETIKEMARDIVEQAYAEQIQRPHFRLITNEGVGMTYGEA